uniref:4a-hydroxytetrahydrobiopterin dehydratase n=1 Tax=Craspedostauros australis TaxID=1486917 RepID=A0A7R9X0M0_9STRA
MRAFSNHSVMRRCAHLGAAVDGPATGSQVTRFHLGRQRAWITAEAFLRHSIHAGAAPKTMVGCDSGGRDLSNANAVRRSHSSFHMIGRFQPERNKPHLRNRDAQRRNLSDDAAKPTPTRPDPFARRPNQKCDPYGQDGKPLDAARARELLLTLDAAWELDTDEVAIMRTFVHPDYLSGAAFAKEMAAVAQMNDHFPSIHLERVIVPRQKVWQVRTTIRCHTRVLEGLSHHDFFLATLIDVESCRPEISALVVPDSNR